MVKQGEGNPSPGPWRRTMFKSALGEILGFVFLVIYLFQPVVHEIYNVRSNAVEIILNQGIAKATSNDNGRFTPEIIAEMKETLKTRFFIADKDINFTGTTSLTPRGEYVEGTLSIKSMPVWLIESMMGKSRPVVIARHATMMSEYIDR
ncbi:hypothetical protein ACFSR7_06140 [Cohnella sp. GCM10020058]|uniref:hypothetical protein n=1 Tax=Cohnella sp. GCM10020058 TaxID=3317330 RepID=UPI003644B466